MPKIRIGLSTNFNLVNEQVGIGTTNPTARVEVAGSILADNTSGSGGISSFREYQGFHQTQSGIANKVTIDASTAGNLNSLSGEIKIDGDVTIAPDTSVSSGKIDSLTTTDKFSVPLGETNNRDNAPEAGTLRFNQDLSALEFFDGVNWKTVNSYAKSGGGGRAVYSGGYLHPVGATKTIGYVTISTLGNAQYHGDLNVAMRDHGAHGNETRALFGAGVEDYDYMQYVNIASGGSAETFGDQIQDRGWTTLAGSSTRAIIAGGWFSPNSKNNIEFVEMSTKGDAVDFGDLTQARYGMAGMNSPVKCVFSGGYKTPSVSIVQDTINTASKGDAVTFGEPTTYHAYPASAGSSVRGINAGGTPNNNSVTGDIIEYVTFASDGKAIDFGNLTRAKRHPSGASSNTRMLMFGGSTTVPSTSNSTIADIDYISIQSGGQAQDFGEMIQKRFSVGAASDCHGGLGGF